MLFAFDSPRRYSKALAAPSKEFNQIFWRPVLDAPGGEEYLRGLWRASYVFVGCGVLWGLYAVALGVLREHFPGAAGSLVLFFRPLVLALHEHIPRAIFATRYIAQHENPELTEIVAHQIVVAHLLLLPVLIYVGYQLVALHTWKGYGDVIGKLPLTRQYVLLTVVGSVTLLCILLLQIAPLLWDQNSSPMIPVDSNYFMLQEVLWVVVYYVLVRFSLVKLTILLRNLHALRQEQRRDSLVAPGGTRHVWHQTVNLYAGRTCLVLWLSYTALLWMLREHYPRVSSALFQSFAPLVSALQDYAPRVAHAAQVARKSGIPGLEEVVAHQVVLGHLLLLALLFLAVHRVVSTHLWAGYGHVYGRLALRPRCLPLVASAMGLWACVWLWEFVPLSAGDRGILIQVESKGLMVVEVLMAGALGFWASAVLMRVAFLLRGVWQLRTKTRSPDKQTVPPPSQGTPG